MYGVWLLRSLFVEQANREHHKRPASYTWWRSSHKMFVSVHWDFTGGVFSHADDLHYQSLWTAINVQNYQVFKYAAVSLRPPMQGFIAPVASAQFLESMTFATLTVENLSSSDIFQAPDDQRRRCKVGWAKSLDARESPKMPCLRIHNIWQIWSTWFDNFKEYQTLYRHGGRAQATSINGSNQHNRKELSLVICLDMPQSKFLLKEMKLQTPSSSKY